FATRRGFLLAERRASDSARLRRRSGNDPTRPCHCPRRRCAPGDDPAVGEDTASRGATPPHVAAGGGPAFTRPAATPPRSRAVPPPAQPRSPPPPATRPRAPACPRRPNRS